jgi:hypothetical protein
MFKIFLSRDAFFFSRSSLLSIVAKRRTASLWFSPAWRLPRKKMQRASQAEMQEWMAHIAAAFQSPFEKLSCAALKHSSSFMR